MKTNSQEIIKSIIENAMAYGVSLNGTNSKITNSIAKNCNYNIEVAKKILIDIALREDIGVISLFVKMYLVDKGIIQNWLDKK